MADLQIRLLGKLTASYNGDAVDLGGVRQRAVLALLLLARGDVVPADRLADSLWGEHAPASTAGTLQSYISHLRRRLHPASAARARSDVIVREGPGYAVRLPRDAVDAWRFESLLEQAEAAAEPAEVATRLREAMGLWKGPALAEYADEPWAEAEIARLTELRSVGRERLLASRLELGGSALLVPELEAMVAEEPLREERWRLLSLALYRANRQADALSALRRARARLADELGVDPGPALRELEAEVLAQSPALDAPRKLVAAGPLPPPTASVPPTDLIEREREFTALRTALDALAAGEPRLLLIEGPAGIGKTRLLAEARRLAAQRSVQVLSSRGSQLETAFAFGVVRQLFEPELATRRDELLRGAAASARGVFEETRGDPGDGSFAILHGLYWLAVNLAGSAPLMLAIDDVQWCDGATLRFLAFLARRIDAVPVLILATMRTGEENENQDLLSELALDSTARVVRPDPLSAEATATIIERWLGACPAPTFTDACYRTTSGNPLLLCQMVRALEAGGVCPDAAHADVAVALGSRAVSSMVLMRLRRAGDEVVAVARAAAVLGDGADFPAVASLAEVSEHRAAAALAVLARSEIVKDEAPLAFVHPLVRDAVYRDLPAAERGLMHERAAAVLRTLRASNEQVAAHVLLAPPRGGDDTVSLLRTAARTASERGASDSALTYLRRALAESPSEAARRDVLHELGLLESRLDGSASVAHLQQAYELYEDPRVRADIAVAMSRTHIFASPPGVATSVAREAAAVLPAELTDHRQALMALQWISAFMHGRDPGSWPEAVREPTGHGHGALMLAAALAFERAVDGSDRERAVALARSALEGDRLLAVDDGLFWIVAAVVRMLADDDLGDFWDRTRAVGQARGSLFTALSTSVWEGFWRWRRGELHDALAHLNLALEQTRTWGGGIGEPYARAFQLGVHLDRGDVEAARRVADEAADPATPPATGDVARLLRQGVAQLLIAEGRHQEALDLLEQGSSPIPIQNPAWDPWRSIAAAALSGLGRTGEAISLAEEEVGLLRGWGAPSYLGAGLRLLGELRGDDGLDQLGEAVALLEATSAELELARARCALGSRPSLPDEQALPLLQAASSAAHACGALGIRDRARAELERRGHPVDFGADAAPHLSANERGILDLVAAGMDVGEVAQRLFLTPGVVRAVVEAAGPDDGEARPQVVLK